MKKKFPLFLLSLLIFTLKSYSQEFTSTIEKTTIQNFKKDSLDLPFIKSLCVIDSTTTEKNIESYINSIDNYIKEFPAKETKPRKEKKKVKLICISVNTNN